MSVLLQSLLVFLAVLAIYVLWRSIVVIGPAEIGLVVKRVSRRHNTTDTPIAFAGEAGYQAELLMPGVRFKLCGRDRRRDLADRRATADRRQVSRLPA